jgi:hypothetical protein
MTLQQAVQPSQLCIGVLLIGCIRQIRGGSWFLPLFDQNLPQTAARIPELPIWRVAGSNGS